MDGCDTQQNIKLNQQVSKEAVGFLGYHLFPQTLDSVMLEFYDEILSRFVELGPSPWSQDQIELWGNPT